MALKYTFKITIWAVWATTLSRGNYWYMPEVLFIFTLKYILATLSRMFFPWNSELYQASHLILWKALSWLIALSKDGWEREGRDQQPISCFVCKCTDKDHVVRRSEIGEVTWSAAALSVSSQLAGGWRHHCIPSNCNRESGCICLVDLCSRVV